jgi:hypothetical protein
MVHGFASAQIKPAIGEPLIRLEMATEVAAAIQEAAMKSIPQLTNDPTRWDLMLQLLAVAGGSVEAVTILGLHVSAGAQTGNTVLLGAAVAQGRLANALGSTCSVVGSLSPRRQGKLFSSEIGTSGVLP